LPARALDPGARTGHAIRCAIVEALKCKGDRRAKVILFNFSGHGLLDLGGYEAFLDGKLTDAPMPDADLAKGLETLPQV